MSELNKNLMIFNRGEDSKLIAQDVELENIEGKPTVKLVPLTRGKLQEVYQKASSADMKEKLDSDNEIIRLGLISPELSEEELLDMKPNIALAVTQAILAISLGITVEEVGKKTDEAVANQELALLKK